MKKISNITLAAIGLGFITSLVSCSDPMEEIKDLTLARNFAPVALTAKVINKTNVKLEWNKSDAQYYVIDDDIDLLLWVNETLVKCVQWQEHPDIAHDQVKLGGNLSLFFPDWAHEIELPNNCSKEQFINIVKEYSNG